MATQIGISPSSFSVNYWKPAWRTFFEDLWSNKKLLNAINERFREEGILYKMVEKPTLEKGGPLEVLIERNRKRSHILKKADRDIVERITTRWIEGGGIEQEIQRTITERPDSIPSY